MYTDSPKGEARSYKLWDELEFELNACMHARPTHTYGQIILVDKVHATSQLRVLEVDEGKFMKDK